MDRAEDKRVVSFTAKMDLSRDLMVSSWAKVDAYGLDFGLGLRGPVAIRRPNWGPMEGLVYLLPSEPGGAVVAAVALREEDGERLKGDVEGLGRWAEFIG